MPSDSYTLTISGLGIAAAHASTHSSGGTDQISINASQVTAGTLPVARGGTGVTAASTGSGGVVLSSGPTLVAPILGTPASGTLTNCTGLPISGLVSSTSTALGVGTIEVGHATDTTISRVSAGKIAVEGNNVVTTSSTDTLTNKTLTGCIGLPLSTGVTGTLPVANGGTGVTQSAYGEYYISTPATTTIAAINTFVKVAGTTTVGTISNFTNSSNRLTYAGTATRKFLVSASISFHGTSGNDYKFAIYKNTSTFITSSSIVASATGTGNLVHALCQCIVELANTDFIEVFVTNMDATNNATVDWMNVSVTALI
jgi:hypothetical protein